MAAGNHGPGRMTVTTPGISRKVITVGCSDDHKEVDVMGSRMVDYSGRGPTMACICKPDIVAPGSGIISCSNEPESIFLNPVPACPHRLSPGQLRFFWQKYPQMTNRDVKLRPAGAGGGHGTAPQSPGMGASGRGAPGGRPLSAAEGSICREPLAYASHRPEAPQGSARPLEVTGRPTSLSGKRPAQPGNKLHSQMIA